MKLILTLTVSLLACSPLWAFEAKLSSLSLYDGTTINVLDVKSYIRGPENRIDSVELYNGVIFYDTEITEIGLLFEDSFSVGLPLDQVRLSPDTDVLRVSGDGSGGG